MAKKSKNKGTFSNINLPVSKKYIHPYSRRRILWIGGMAVTAIIIFAFLNFYLQNASLASKGPLSSSHANLQEG